MVGVGGGLEYIIGALEFSVRVGEEVSALIDFFFINCITHVFQICRAYMYVY